MSQNGVLNIGLCVWLEVCLRLKCLFCVGFNSAWTWTNTRAPSDILQARWWDLHNKAGVPLYNHTITLLTKKASLSGSTSCMYLSRSKLRVSETYSANGAGGRGGVSGWLNAYFVRGRGPALTLRVSVEMGKYYGVLNSAVIVWKKDKIWNIVA